MEVGYLPDTFGHCSQMPQILSKFGLKAALVWRGISGLPHELKSEFIWKSPDGTGIFTVHLSDERGYFNVVKIPVNLDEASEKVKEAVSERLEYATTGHVLIMNGFDHMPPGKHAGEVLRLVDNKLEDIEVIHGSIENYVDRVKAEAKELQDIQKELMLTNLSPRGKVNYILRNVMSSRIYLKQKNYESEKLLEKYAEPHMSQLFMEKGKYASGFINLAWKYLVQNHAHDSICGCSIDSVHKDMERRFAWACDIASQCSHEGMYGIIKDIDTSRFEKTAVPVHLFNTLCCERAENAVEITVDLKQDEFFRSIIVKGDDGREIPCQITDIKDVMKVYNTLEKYPEWRKVKEVGLVVEAGNIPSFGYKSICVKPDIKPTFDRDFIAGYNNVMENEYLKVMINTNGTVNVLNKETGRLFTGLNYFTDGGDIGDEYVYSPPFVDSVINTTGCSPVISLVHNGPLIAVYGLRYYMDVPGACEREGYKRDEGRFVRNIIESNVILRKGSRVVEFETTIQNNAGDHRIRVMFPTGINTRYVYADGHFDVIKRDVEVIHPDRNAWIESGSGVYPQKRFIDVSDALNGIAVFNQGLPEYEIIKENDGCIVALTLLRCVDRLFSDRSRTISSVGFEISAPEAQCIGKYKYKYAIYFHAGGWEDADVNFEAEKYHVPVNYIQGSIHDGSLPLEKSYLKIDNSKVCVTAVKKAEDRDAVIIRLCNLSSRDELVRIILISFIKKAYLTDLKEDRIKELPVEDGKCVTVNIKTREIMTVEIELKDKTKCKVGER